MDHDGHDGIQYEAEEFKLVFECRHAIRCCGELEVGSSVSLGEQGAENPQQGKLEAVGYEDLSSSENEVVEDCEVACDSAIC